MVFKFRNQTPLARISVLEAAVYDPTQETPVLTETCQVLVVGTSIAAQAAQECLQRRGSRTLVRSAVALGERVGVLTSPAATLAPRVIAVDPAAHTATLSNGTRIRWDALILAPSPGIAGDVRGEVDAVGSVEDARAVMAIRRRPRRVAVIGDGLAAWEIAAAVRARGPATTLVTSHLSRLPELVGTSAAGLLEETHRANGVTILEGRAPRDFDGSSLHLEDGSAVPATLVLDAREALVDTRFLGALGVGAAAPIEVDDDMRVGPDGIYAVGDLARWRDPVTGRLLHLDHAAGQRRQGEIAADAVLGGSDRLDAVPFRRSRHFDLALTLLGAPCPDDLAEFAGGLSRGGETITWRGVDGVTAVLTITRDEAQRRSA